MMRTESKERTDGVEIHLHFININKIVLQSQRELLSFLSELENLESVFKTVQFCEKMPVKEEHEYVSPKCVTNSLGEDYEKEVDHLIEQFEESMNFNIETMKKLLNHSKLIGFGYTFLILKEKEKLMKVERELEKQKHEEVNKCDIKHLSKTFSQISMEEKVDENDPYDVMEEMRLKEMILLSKCIRKQQKKELEVSKNLIAKIDSEISDQKVVLDHLQIQKSNHAEDLGFNKSDTNKNSFSKSPSEVNGTDFDSFNDLCEEYTKIASNSIKGDLHNDSTHWMSCYFTLTPRIQLPLKTICFPVTHCKFIIRDAPRVLIRKRSRQKNRFLFIRDKIYRTDPVSV